MAHTAKVKRHFVGQLGAHIDRLRGGGQHYGNENIDLERTPMNYDLSGCDTPLTQIVREAVDAAPRTVRKDAVVLGSTVVTLPRDWPDGRDPREFFEAVRAFDLGFWPKSYREVRATVHMDETTPHLHHVFVPLDAKGQPNFNGTYTRKLYQRYHAELQRWVCDACGLDELHILLDEDDVAGKALSALDQGAYKAAKAAEAHAIERAEAAQAEAAAAEGHAREASERLDRLRSEEERAELEVGAREEELVAIDAGAGERRRYLDAHEGEGRREPALDRELGELVKLGRAVAGRAEELERERDRAAERVRRLEREVAQARERVGRLERLVRSARRRAVAIMRRLRAAGERVVEAMRTPHVLTPSQRADRALRDAAVASWSRSRELDEMGGHHGIRI